MPLNSTPLVSIFMPVKNGMPWVTRAIDSILNQTWPNIEVIVQDGCSTDGTLDYLKSLGQSIKLISEKDSGPNQGFMRALSRCSGDIIGNCLSDEWLFPDAVEKAVHYLSEHPHTGTVVGTTIECSVDHVKHIKTVKPQYFDMVEFLCCNYMPHSPGTFFRRSILESLGFWKNQWNDNGLENEFWMRMACETAIGPLEEPFSRYGCHPHQLSLNVHIDSVPQIKAHLSFLEEAFSERGFFGENFILYNLSRLFRCRHARLGISINPNPLNLKIKDFIDYLYKTEVICDQNIGRHLHLEMIKKFPHRDIESSLRLYFYQEMGKFYRRRGQIEQALFCYCKGLISGDWTAGASFTTLCLYLSHSVEENQRDILTTWFNINPLKERQIQKKIDPHKPITIGYLCKKPSDFDLLDKLSHLEQYHDCNHFKVILYLPDYQDFPNFKRAHRLHAVQNLNQQKFIDLVIQDNLNILVTLANFEETLHVTSLCTRLAPIQINFSDHLGTMGQNKIDWLLTDAYSQSHFSHDKFVEKIYGLPGNSVCLSDKQLCKIPEYLPPKAQDFTLFGCLGSAELINDEMIAQWSKILKKVPHSRLFLRNEGLIRKTNRQFMIRRFERHGIDANRLILKSEASYQQYSYDLQDITICLDTWPLSNASMVVQSLYYGVPVLTIADHRLRSLRGASILNQIKCPDLIVNNWEDYQERAVQLANHPDQIHYYNKILRDRLIDSGLMDGQSYVQKIEAAYIAMIEGLATNPPTA